MKTQQRRTKKLYILPAAALLLLLTALLASLLFCYHADETALRAMASDETVTVEQTQYGWLFDGPSEDRALIFYPGADVEETAYAPLLHVLAENGLDVCLVKMPFQLAVLDANAGDTVLETYNYPVWYIGGHSLGGYVAAEYAGAHTEQFAGVVLLGAYPTRKIPDSMAEVLIVGSEDRIVNWSRIEKGRQYAPPRYTEAVIEGGNHAQFGSYGPQLGDGTASISAEEQISQSVRVITEALYYNE